MAKIILLSGGMDSLISYRLFCPDHIPVFVRSGSRYAIHDYKAAASFAGQRLRLLCLPDLQEHASGMVPHRNTILIAMAANMWNADEVVVSAPRGELIWDQQPAFHRELERVLRGVRVANPLRKLTKAQAVALWRRQRPTAELYRSRSCYSSEPGQCGACPACVKRWVAMRCNGLEEHYRGDVRAYARELATGTGAWRQALRYGLRPTLEGLRAYRAP